jgi:hypothetical protein
MSAEVIATSMAPEERETKRVKYLAQHGYNAASDARAVVLNITVSIA